MGEVAPSRLMVLLFTDIVGSVDLKTRLGDNEAGQLIAGHDRLFREVVGSIGEAEVLKDTGDGFLARFATTREAVIAALRFQYALSQAGSRSDGKDAIRVRIGLHLGEVSELARDDTGRAKISGLAVDIAARVMGLALPAQILMTRAAFDNARQYVREHPPIEGDNGTPALSWMAHGPYLFQGHDEPMEVFEVGGVGIAPLKVPVDVEKARRAVAADEEETLGWRPGAGLSVPGRTGWILERRLGEGGFGEVWLGANRRTGSHRVFKFCYDAERLRSFKRELTLFRLLRETLGDRDDIARLYEVRLDEPPFYLESEYTEQGSLVDWAKAQGGIDTVPLATRLDLVARIADAVAAAHSVGVLHKDIKPANILIHEQSPGDPRPRLSDFGIGKLTDEARARERGITIAGFTRADDEPSQTGTMLYAPPETLVGSPFTMQGDVYALGVLLYQMAAGDLERPLAQGWERDVADRLLRNDIAVCVAGNESDRLSSAKLLAERLRTLPQRRRAALRRRIARIGSLAAAVLMVLLVIAVSLGLRERHLRNVAEANLARKTAAMDFFVAGFVESADPTRTRAGEPTTGHLVTVASKLDQMMEDADKSFERYPDLKAEAFRTLGLVYKNLQIYGVALETMERALKIRQQLYRGEHVEIAESLLDVGDVHYWLKDFDTARKFHEQSLQMRKRLLPPESAEVAESMNSLAATLNALGQMTEAEAYYREALAIREVLSEEDPDFDRMLIAASHNNLGTCLREQGVQLLAKGDEGCASEKFDEAEKHFLEAIDLMRLVGGEQHFYLAKGLHNLAKYYAVRGKVEDARRSFVDALEMKRDRLGDQNVSVAETHYEYGKFLLDQNEYDAALEQAQRALEIRREVFPQEHPEIAESLELLDDIDKAINPPENAEAA